MRVPWGVVNVNDRTGFQFMRISFFIIMSCNLLVNTWHEIVKPEMVLDWQFYVILMPLVLFIELLGWVGAW